MRRRIGLILLTLAIIAALIYGFWPQPVWVEAAVVAGRARSVQIASLPA